MKKSTAHLVNRRKDTFVEKTKTRLWFEKPTDDNPYIADQVYCHGYELFDLMENCSYVDMLYLLFKGELPDSNARVMLEKLMMGLMNPGPRHPATRAAMNAGVGKTLPVHILPIASMVMGGERQCAGSVEKSMRFLCKNYHKSAASVADSYLTRPDQQPGLPSGFGQSYGGIDIQAQKLAETLLKLPGAGDVLRWGNSFAAALNTSSKGWLPIGVAAAVFVDLGFHPKFGASLYQLFSAPGLVAHGLELYSKPLTEMPHIKDADYVIKNK